MLTVTSDNYAIKAFKEGHVVLGRKGKADYLVTNVVKIIDTESRQQFFVKGESMSIEPSYSTARKYSIESINHTINALFGHLLTTK